jgi:hypothetical protein
MVNVPQQNKRIRLFLWSTACLFIIIVILMVVRAVFMDARAKTETMTAFHVRTVYGGFLGPHKLPRTTIVDETNRPLFSWRFYVNGLIMGPYWEEKKDRFKHRWDSDYNKDIESIRPPWFCFSSSTNANVFAVTGKGTAFGDNDPLSLKSIPPDTILLIEVKDSGIHWMEPGDIRVDELTQKNTEGVRADGVHVLFADGQVWYLSRNTPIENIRKLCYVERGGDVTRDSLLKKYALKMYERDHWDYHGK